ncbi:26S proteasome non-ATPase regulatory subunit 4-like [Porphyridium purpureum]|uniref:26S proteasome non-ATPase regulatory subunit 4-like n=1 Tax=Porphyridium purpureum TaxID=35688 RepID=A0A5J4Z1Z4_PORPP|nr:26S proteasome non-ATPase regulatory subunit 4-like [Porphyridium purpureum]|eukprot:POR0744..scf295_1
MPLEALMVCVDNSEYMRNGDYPPSRLDAQTDAVNLVCSAKIEQNPENVVGLLTTAGRGARILETSTQDLGRILQSMHEVKMEGSMNLIMALQKAQLALKHRENQYQRPRIVAFVGSPIDASEEALVTLAKKLKKNGVAVDIVSFGELEQNASKLEAFIAAVNSGDNSHLVSIPPGSYIMSDILITSPIIVDGAVDGGAGGSSDAGGAAARADFPFGVDPAADPELAMALRISMEEEQARIAAAQQQAASGAAPDAGASADSGPDASVSDAAKVALAAADAADAADADLYGETGADSGTADMDVVGADEDEEMRLAIEMSLAEEKARKDAEQGKPE